MNDTYKVPVIAGSSPNCGFALTGRHSVEGRNIYDMDQHNSHQCANSKRSEVNKESADFIW